MERYLIANKKETSIQKAEPSGRSEGNARVSEDQIRARAYELHMARGDGPGDAMSDWLEAECELRQPAHTSKEGRA
jgi:hypothetical protein